MLVRHHPNMNQSAIAPQVQPEATEDGFVALCDPVNRRHSYKSTKMVVDPPNLAEWRQRLFHCDGVITMTEDE